MNRREHMAWCKKRALEYVDANDNEQAFASMMSDIGKHPETDTPALRELGMMLMMTGQLQSSQQMRDFINGFN